MKQGNLGNHVTALRLCISDSSKIQVPLQGSCTYNLLTSEIIYIITVVCKDTYMKKKKKKILGPHHSYSDYLLFTKSSNCAYFGIFKHKSQFVLKF